MILQFTVKQLGKRKPYLAKKEMEFPFEENRKYTLEEILKTIVIKQVEEFNAEREEKNLFNFLGEQGIMPSQKDQSLSEETIEAKLTEGKVKFNDIYNTKLANEEKAIETVLYGFKDGIIVVFHNQAQIEKLEEEIELKEKDEFVFVRLTFLAGGW
ncbi:hypothetical protein [Aureivirga sp. CE67]|uniref:hypothetical protein n=1 Tax=Aureivirga sp. CE67 TaxID=1788983 RepID=UPI0018CBCBBA|nr:hypothetical protein [Aureivirga sp. CE67]